MASAGRVDQSSKTNPAPSDRTSSREQNDISKLDNHEESDQNSIGNHTDNNNNDNSNQSSIFHHNHDDISRSSDNDDEYRDSLNELGANTVSNVLKCGKSSPYSSNQSDSTSSSSSTASDVDGDNDDDRPDMDLNEHSISSDSFVSGTQTKSLFAAHTRLMIGRDGDDHDDGDYVESSGDVQAMSLLRCRLRRRRNPRHQHLSFDANTRHRTGVVIHRHATGVSHTSFSSRPRPRITLCPEHLTDSAKQMPFGGSRRRRAAALLHRRRSGGSIDEKAHETGDGDDEYDDDMLGSNVSDIEEDEDKDDNIYDDNVDPDSALLHISNQDGRRVDRDGAEASRSESFATSSHLGSSSEVDDKRYKQLVEPNSIIQNVSTIVRPADQPSGSSGLQFTSPNSASLIPGGGSAAAAVDNCANLKQQDNNNSGEPTTLSCLRSRIKRVESRPRETTLSATTNYAHKATTNATNLSDNLQQCLHVDDGNDDDDNQYYHYSKALGSNRLAHKRIAGPGPKQYRVKYSTSATTTNSASSQSNSTNLVQCSESHLYRSLASVVSNRWGWWLLQPYFRIFTSLTSIFSANYSRRNCDICICGTGGRGQGDFHDKSESSREQERKHQEPGSNGPKEWPCRCQVCQQPACKSSSKMSARPEARYQVLPGADDHRPMVKASTGGSGSRRTSVTRKKSSTAGREYQRMARSQGYHKLSQDQYLKPARSQSNVHSLKRILLLIVIVSLCCFGLWKLYQVLTADYNYLGYINSASELGQFKKYAVSTDAKPCARVGRQLLDKGGSAVDAAIGTLICMGVVLPNSLGLGGGCLMTLYDKQSGKSIIIDGREVAPSYAHEHMFDSKPEAASRGPLSVGVPGELAAYWKAHQSYGKLKWSELFEASIEMADKGVPTVEHMAFALRAKGHAYRISPVMAPFYTNAVTGQYLDEGDLLVQKELAGTLRRLRDFGAQDFYGGETGRLFIDDLAKQGGNLSLADLTSYEAVEREPLVVQLGHDLWLHTQPPPGSGVILSVIMRIMKQFGYAELASTSADAAGDDSGQGNKAAANGNKGKPRRPQESLEDAALYYHRLTEAMKFAYAQRAGLEDKPDEPDRMARLMAKLSSEAFVLDAVSKIDNVTHDDNRYGGGELFGLDHGTAHVSVLDGEGNAAAITSSVNLYFGSGLISPRTGIVYNDVMDDFVSPNLTNKFRVPPSKYNRIRPGRRPLSSMAPSVFTDSLGNVRLIVGASGGTKITTSLAAVSMRHLYLAEHIKSAIDGPRIHHQYLPNHIMHELNFPKNLIAALKEPFGHRLAPILDRSSVVMAVAQSQGPNQTRSIQANSDYRKGGAVDGL